MAKIFETDKEYKADIKVCEVKEYKADMKYSLFSLLNE